ncbi:MAG TPA: adenosylhomocysteinase [Candidatus Limiplasma sp.]|nr:adenosylhomocysteinase [Candidatus Limiplasma sp.]HRX09123.1 adenosylhomocysteinase [Candidatus Limiplasma sp.]
MSSIIRNAALAPKGLQKIEWAKGHMPILHELETRFVEEKPFQGLRVAMSVHMEAKTARLALLFKAGGAEVNATGCNTLSTQDDVAAGLATQGVNVFAWHAATDAEYHDHLIQTLSCKPHLILDDGGDLTQILCDERPDLAENLLGGGEETTTGVMRLRARAANGTLGFPMVSVNDAKMKSFFDNRYGTGQSVWDGIDRTTNLVVAGKTVVVAGYGWCGKGVSMRAKGLGAQVVITEVDPVKAVEAVMDGFTVLPMAQAVKTGDIFITVTGCKDIITPAHMKDIKEGAVLCNAGHFNVEVAVAKLKREATRIEDVRENIEALSFDLPEGDTKTVYLLAEGKLVNLAAGDGHPAEIMDISFALQALCLEHVAMHSDALTPGVYPVPDAIDSAVAALKLKTLGVAIDTLTDEQAAYIRSENG